MPDAPAADPLLKALFAAIDAEVRAGLPNERAGIDCAVENQAFFDLDALRYLPRREAEGTTDHQSRRHLHGRETGLTREAIEVLTEHLYGPGPSRRWDDPAGDDFLQRVYTDNLIDAVMQQADVLAHLNDVAALQVDAGAGDFDARPITLHLWGRDEFVAWTSPGDAKKVAAVVTIDRLDLTTRYKLWTADTVRVYETRKAEHTSGGVVAELAEVAENTYGCLPFAFVHYSLPVRRFQTPGIGTFLRKAEYHANDRLTRLDEAIHKHLNPIPWAEGMPVDWNPVIEPGRWLKFLQAPRFHGGTGGYEPPGEVRVGYLQATVDVEAAWKDLTLTLNQQFEACRVPLSAVRMEQSGTASGVAIVAEQEPLLRRARKRRGPAGVFEGDLARAILACAGAHYGRPELAASAGSGRLTLGWSEPTITIPGPDRDESDLNALKLGVTSRLRLIMDRYGATREQAIEILKGIAEDRKVEDAIDPEPVALDRFDGKGNGGGNGNGHGAAPGGGASEDTPSDSEATK